MALISQSISTLSSGVSQQPAALRTPTSAERMENAWPSVVSGLQKRPPTEHVAQLSFTVADNACGHIINRADGYQYVVVANQDGLKVVDIDGGEYPVAYPQGTAYLTSASSPVDDLRFLTYGDYTFVLNRNVTVQQTLYGEAGMDEEFVPDYSVNRLDQLPSGVSVGDTAYVSGTDSYYRYETRPAVPTVYGWVPLTNWMELHFNWYGSMTAPVINSNGSFPDNPYPSATPATSLPSSAGINDKVYMWDNSVRKGMFAYPSRGNFRFFNYEVVTAGSAAFNGWVKRSLSELFTGGSVTDRKDPSAYGTIYVTQSIANSYYTVYIDNILKASFLTKNGTDASNSVESSSVIAQELATQLTTNGFTVQVLGSTISISGLNENTVIRTVANSGDKALRNYRDTVQLFTDLPPNDVSGRLVRIGGTPGTTTDSYYVVFRDGVWVEEEGWNMAGGFRADTMPHVLVRNSDNTFTFKPFEWGVREVGDLESNADPSFVSRTINDIFVHANRLGLLSDENVIFSESDNIPNFYRKTVAQLLDDDRVDVAVISKDVSILSSAIPFAEDLVLLSDNTQYKLQYSNFLSPKNVRVSYMSSFNASTRVKPVNMGSSVYFVDDAKTYGYGRVMEMYIRDDNSQADADDVTSAVPEYVPADIRFIAASPRMKLLLAGSNKDPNALYVHKYYWADNQKVQNAWGRWEFPDCSNVHWAGFLNNYLYLVMERNGSIFFERMKVDEDVFTNSENYTAHVDRRIDKELLTLSYAAGPNETTVTIPFTTSGSVEIISTDTEVTALRHNVTKINNTTFKINGNITAADDIQVGVPYTFLYEFSRIYMRQEGKLVLEGRLQLRYVTLEFHNTAYFQFTTQLPGRDPITTTFNGTQIGGVTSILGQAAFSSGAQRIPMMANAADVTLTITNDGPFSNAFGTAEWQGVYQPKTQRTG